MMKEAGVSFRPVALLFLALLVALPARPQDKPPAMSESDVMQLLKIQVSSAQIVTGIKKMGINFQTFEFLNHPFLNLGNTGVTSTSFGNITGVTRGARTSQIRGYVSW